MNKWQSWGRVSRSKPAKVVRLTDRFSPLQVGLGKAGGMLAYGRGRSYGDVCLNKDGALLYTAGLDRFIAFDRTTGVLRCEAGVTLRDILALVVPQDWFLSVTPGTRDVTVGGAVANDVHGKNHHVAGSFGNHVRCFEILRSTGERLSCSPQENPEQFAATIGGLGLTGLITWVEIQLSPVANPFMYVETKRFRNLDEFWEVNQEAEARWPYTVAWIDCLARGRERGRGIFLGGSHATPQTILPTWRERHHTVPLDPPLSLINRLSLRAFNAIYWRRTKNRYSLAHYVPYFYPLDAISNWNRIYGRAGFYQYQCVLPPNTMREGIAGLLEQISRSRQGSFLAVLKTFGNRRSLGTMSFPRPGATLALDFPNKGNKTLKLFDELDAVVREAGGALYPAKDARMPGAMFRASFPQWENFSKHLDPAFSSDFWRRVTS
ncbi:MAG: FAD-binding oxidoreductase [Gammaproteobacteria bacterium]|jgi:FAD/FMN-containing dehydrogenase